MDIPVVLEEREVVVAARIPVRQVAVQEMQDGATEPRLPRPLALVGVLERVEQASEVQLMGEKVREWKQVIVLRLHQLRV